MPDQQVPDQQAHHDPQPAPRKRARRRVAPPELRMTSMVDVVFLLLIFFIITASFIQDEGTLLAHLPGNAAPPPASQTIEPTVVLLELISADDGVTYTLSANGRSIDGGASELHNYLRQRLATDMKPEDKVEIKPNGKVRWQHVVNVFNACVKADLEQVGFAPAS